MISSVPSHLVPPTARNPLEYKAKEWSAIPEVRTFIHHCVHDLPAPGAVGTVASRTETPDITAETGIIALAPQPPPNLSCEPILALFCIALHLSPSEN